MKYFNWWTIFKLDNSITKRALREEFKEAWNSPGWEGSESESVPSEWFMAIELPILCIQKLKVDYFFGNWPSKLGFEFWLTTTDMHKTIAWGVSYLLDSFEVKDWNESDVVWKKILMSMSETQTIDLNLKIGIHLHHETDVSHLQL